VAMAGVAGRAAQLSRRIAVETGESTADSAAQQAPGLQIQILKRRGPLLERPIQLALSQWAWQPVLQAQAQRHARQSEEAAMLMQGA
jgi:protein ImuA